MYSLELFPEEEVAQVGIVYEGRTYFSTTELKCKGSGMIKLAPGFAEKLLELRLLFDEPMIINSACRSEAHNRKVGGHPRSLHVCDFPARPTGGCCAVDVRTWQQPPEYRQRLIELARAKDWSIGYGSGFLHLDRRIDYTDLPRADFNY